MNRDPDDRLALSDADEAEIQRQIAADPDDFAATDEELAAARPFAEVLPELMDSIRRARGRPPLDNTKKPITIRLDAEVVDYYRATGKGWQSRVNMLLKKAAGL